jgi:hypothetical protein
MERNEIKIIIYFLLDTQNYIFVLYTVQMALSREVIIETSHPTHLENISQLNYRNLNVFNVIKMI